MKMKTYTISYRIDDDSYWTRIEASSIKEASRLLIDSLMITSIKEDK